MVLLLRVRRKRRIEGDGEAAPSHTILLEEDGGKRRRRCVLVDEGIASDSIHRQTQLRAAQGQLQHQQQAQQQQQQLSRGVKKRLHGDDDAPSSSLISSVPLPLSAAPLPPIVFDEESARLHHMNYVSAPHGPPPDESVVVDGKSYLRVPTPGFDLAMDKAIFLAFNYRKFDDLFRLVDREGKDVNTARTQSDFTTALMAACKWGDVRTVEELIRRGADPDMVDLHGNSAFSFAAKHEDVELRNALLAALRSAADTVYDLYVVQEDDDEDEDERRGKRETTMANGEFDTEEEEEEEEEEEGRRTGMMMTLEERRREFGDLPVIHMRGGSSSSRGFFSGGVMTYDYATNSFTELVHDAEFGGGGDEDVLGRGDGRARRTIPGGADTRQEDEDSDSNAEDYYFEKMEDEGDGEGEEEDEEEAFFRAMRQQSVMRGGAKWERRKLGTRLAHAHEEDEDEEGEEMYGDDEEGRCGMDEGMGHQCALDRVRARRGVLGGGFVDRLIDD